MPRPKYASGGCVGPGTPGDSILPRPLEMCSYTLPDTSRSTAARGLLAEINEQGPPMHLPELPDEIQSEDVQRALESLGITPTRLTETVIRPHSIEVTYLRTGADGEVLTGSNDSVSRITTTIRVRWPKRAT
ncbi:hypothetical protein PBI_HOWE_77 [Gordonia phage Howe]|uniref:Uncharacterized protein n=1 Tax=Gordonia phage Howe TaxID=1777061 RepID=A0A0U4IHZ0_9CAUD|nr:hypothetical protein PP513_gp77 [Gordonia phage Howe]AZF93262.1 hypothetical protein SEA_ADORA_74 [Gordonia phage Adora]QDF16857.1 hypothetical protein SEA_TWINKLE_76 [Gordonia phage Twinkle]QYC54476.1 hypothetical protein SEA_SHLIM410_75 [Gordonia phage Shlim410]UAJ16326.1 hypothetical protein SEA_HORTENSE_77 [Gordonia phage Hortense]ALY07711.1 hypothetical protein PBI_HOWE_77 [Gordonia phage Howe]